MKFTLSWLLLHLDINLSLQDALNYCSDSLLNLGFESEIESLNGLYIVKILTVKNIPNKEIKHCEVLYKGTILNIVCGASNIEIGRLALFAPIGTKINNISIQERTICGIKSQGMMIGASEIYDKLTIVKNETENKMYINDYGISNYYKIENNDSLIYFDEKFYNQDDLFWCEDIILNLELPTYRSDLCVRGLARELNFSKNNNEKVKLKELPIGKTSNEELKTKIINETDELFSVMEVENIKISSKIKKIMNTLNLGQNNLQMLNDFILMDISHPIHIYELSFSEFKICYQNGKLITLADNKLASNVGIKGIIGFNANTKNVLIEAAYVKVDSYETAAAKIFSIGVDSEQQTLAYVTSLIEGNISKIKFTGKLKEKKEIFLPQSLVCAITGDTISINKQKEILCSFGFICDAVAEDRKNNINQEFGLNVKSPSWRNDIETPHDLISELVRIMGVTFGKAQPINIIKTENQLDQLRYLLLNKGLNEIYTLPFSKNGSIELLNPIDKNMRYMRMNLFKRLHNVFEIGKVYSMKKEENLDIPSEEIHLFVSFKKCIEVNDWNNTIKYDFYYLKQFISSLSMYLNVDVNNGENYEDDDYIGIKLSNGYILNTRDDEYVMADIRIDLNHHIHIKNKNTEINNINLIHINILTDKNTLWREIQQYLSKYTLIDIYHTEKKIKYTIECDKNCKIEIPENIGKIVI